MSVMYLQTHEVAKRVGRSSETIRLWERLGRIPAIRTGRGMRLFREEDVAKLERELAKTASSPAACEPSHDAASCDDDVRGVREW